MQDYTGVAAIFETGRPGPVLAIRFDMDCVDVDEAHEAGHRPFDEGWASTNPGHMHSCGHDGHTTMGIAVCNWIQETWISSAEPSKSSSSPLKKVFAVHAQ